MEYEIAQTRLLLAQGVATYYRQWQLLLETRQRVAQRAQLNREREQVVRELIRAGQSRRAGSMRYSKAIAVFRLPCQIWTAILPKCATRLPR